MVLDTLNNTTRIEALHPLFKQAFDHLKNTDFSQVKDGMYELNGKNLFISIATLSGKNKEEALIETHKKYIDIQMPLSGVEEIGWKAADQLQKTASPYQTEQDIAFFYDKPTAYTSIHPGQFVVYFPEDGHAPGIGSGEIRKVVVKIAVDY